jgi:arabinogalactan oligomer / maltooligosaccharide transport system substrate-binding protein
MLKNFRMLTIIFALMFFTANIAACANKKVDEEEEKETVSIEFYESESPGVQRVLDSIIEDFQEENEDIIVRRIHVEEYEITDIFNGASKEDEDEDEEEEEEEDDEEDKSNIVALISSDKLGDLAEKKKIQPVSDFKNENGNNTINKKAEDAVKIEDEEYMLPVSFCDQLILIYNKKFVTTPPETFDELINMSKSLKNENKVQYGLVLNIGDPLYTVPFLGAFGGKLFVIENGESKPANLNTPASKEWLNYTKMLQEEEVIPKEPDFKAAEALFKEEKAAFIIHSAESFHIFDGANIQYGTAPLPTVDGKYLSPYTMVKGYVVSLKSEEEEQEEAVKEFIDYLNKKDNKVMIIEQSREIPISEDLLEDDKIKKIPNLNVQLTQFDRSLVMPAVPGLSDIREAIAEVVTAVLTERISSDEAPAKIQKALEQGKKGKDKEKNNSKEMKNNKKKKK